MFNSKEKEKQRFRSSGGRLLSHVDRLNDQLPRQTKTGREQVPGIRQNAEASMDLSYNFFSGNVSGRSGMQENCLAEAMDQRSLKECQDFYSKRGLAFRKRAIDSLNKQGVAIGRRRTGKVKSFSAVLGWMLGGLGLIVVIIATIILIKQSRKAGSSSSSKVTSLGPFAFAAMASIRLGEKFSYAQVKHATKNFNPSNLMKAGHSGELYRGLLAGAPVVVKRIVLDGSSISSMNNTLTREVELFERASHTRLVPLLGHCLELEKEKFLVYKYMHNGDLLHALKRPSSRDDNLQTLDWITRLKIAIGAAEGLVFLHHECFPPIAHRDIQASSVLLDEQFEGRLGSLSDTSVVEGEGPISCFCRMSQSSNVHLLAGTQISTFSYDVYCFGKLLLELITGNSGGVINGQEFGDAWLEWTLSHISIYDKEAMTKVVDVSLILDEDLLEEVWAMGIVAKSCLNPRPSRRPLMRYVLKALENPLKVVRYDHAMNGTSLRSRNSSYGSWNTAFFGSLRHTISDSTQGLLKDEGHLNNNSSKINVKLLGNGSFQHVIGTMQGDIPKRKTFSSEIFPEPITDQSLIVEPTNANQL